MVSPRANISTKLVDAPRAGFGFLGVSDPVEDGVPIRTGTTTGQVAKWKDATMVNRWAAAGMLEAERSFRRVKGHGDMRTLLSEVHAEVARRIAEKEGGTLAPTKYDQAVA